MNQHKPLIYDLSLSELEHWLSTQGEPKFRAKQIYVGLYQNFRTEVGEITTLPKALRGVLTEHFDMEGISPVRKIQSNNGLTSKTLFELQDGCLIETVLMMYDERRTVCISAQSGCGLGCTFCATGQMGLSRNLTSGEIVAQVIYHARLLAKTDDRVTNVVLMGMGEPFQNYEDVMAAITRLNDPDGFGLGARRMTISTVGIVPKIKTFADENSQVNLAVSLHTVDDDLRSELIPVNRKYPVSSVLSACRYYTMKTNRRVTFEYALIDGVNDSEKDALALAQQIRGMLCHVNLIALNPTRKYNRSGSRVDQVQAFYDVLESHHIPCTIRLRRGIEIGAGCGQLAAGG
ncbi:MAG: 23S rRNA (adenine(2503)-C(2))-methyltransferase RlmN [Brevefilum sp.]